MAITSLAPRPSSSAHSWVEAKNPEAERIESCALADRRRERARGVETNAALQAARRSARPW